MEKKGTNCEKIFAMCISGKEKRKQLASRAYKELLKLNYKKRKKGANGLENT